MIIGSYYLGKKARKAYRNHKAEKVATQLVGPMEVVDPSEELTLKAPPVSPIERAASPSLIHSDSVPTSSRPQEHRCAGQSSNLTPSSTYSSCGQASATSEHSNDYAQLEQRDLPVHSQEPPSYDDVVNSPRVDRRSATGLSYLDHGYHPYADPYRGRPVTLDECPTCIALLHQHHFHQFQPLHSHAHPQYSGGDTSSLTAQGQPVRLVEAPTAAELPGPSAHRQGLSTSNSQPILEMPDTSPMAEMPAQVPGAL